MGLGMGPLGPWAPIVNLCALSTYVFFFVFSGLYPPGMFSHLWAVPGSPWQHQGTFINTREFATSAPRSHLEASRNLTEPPRSLLKPSRSLPEHFLAAPWHPGNLLKCSQTRESDKQGTHTVKGPAAVGLPRNNTSIWRIALAKQVKESCWA